MRLTKQTGHAIRILIACARSDLALLKVAEISDDLCITKQNVFKIVHLLSRAGLITSVRGPSGGVKLARKANEIRIGDVVRSIEITDIVIADEKSAGLAHKQQNAPINRVFDSALAAFVSVLDQYTLAELASPTKKGRKNSIAPLAPPAARKKPARSRA